MVIVIPAHLPKAETYTVSICDKHIRFRAGYENIAEILYQGPGVYERIINNTQIGLVEYPPGDDFPPSITQVAYVDVRRTV